MSVSVNVSNIKFYKQWFNGTTFGSNLTNYTQNLAGLVMQKIKLIQDVSISWETTTLGGIEFDVSIAGRFFREDSGSFITDGFSVGDTAHWYENTVYKANITVDSISSDGKTMHYTINSGTVTDGSHPYLTGITPLTSLIYNFGLIENGENYNDISKVSDESQGWYSLGEIGADDGMGGRLTTWVDMEALGIPNSWVSGSSRVKFLSDSTGFGSTYQKFQIEHTFIIPHYSVGDLDDLIDGISPDYLANNNSLKYAFSVDFRTVISNPNTGKKTIYKDNLGSVGFFGESFNGLDSNYKVNSVTYTDTSLGSTDALLIGQDTLVTVEIEKLVGNFGTDEVGVYFSYLPELQAEVKNTPTTYEENYIYDNIFCTIGGSAVSGSNVLDNALAVATTNILTITFKTSFTALQQLKLSNTKSYVLGFEVGDSTISAGNSDQVILKEVALFDDSADVPDLMTFDIEFYPYTEDFSTAGVSDFRGWNEHGLASKGSFILDLTKDAFINSFSAKLIAYNPTTGNSFELDSYDFLMDNSLVTAGGYTYQGLLVNTTRGYELISGSEKNSVSILFDVTTVGTSSPKYDITFAQKIRWEDWIKNTQVDNIFTNYTKPNNNLNYKASNYSNLSGYDIRMLYTFNVRGTSYLGVTANTTYNFFTNPFRIFNYDKDGFTPPKFTQVIETFTADGLTNLSGAILVGQDTLFKITWTYLTPILDITGYWGIHRIQEAGDTGQQIFELGSYEDNKPNQILKGITTDYLDLTLTAGKLVTTCLIDGTKTIAGVKYDLSGEIATPFKPKGNNTFTAKIQEDGTYKVLEDGTYKYIEN